MLDAVEADALGSVLRVTSSSGGTMSTSDGTPCGGFTGRAYDMCAQGGSGGGGGGVTTPPGGGTQSSQFSGDPIIQNEYAWLTSKCGIAWDMFGLGFIGGLLGLPVTPNWIAIGLSWGTDIVGLYTAGVAHDIPGQLLALLQFIWDAITTIVKSIADWLTQALAAVGLAADWAPGVIPGKLAIMAISMGMNLASIAEEGCL